MGVESRVCGACTARGPFKTGSVHVISIFEGVFSSLQISLTLVIRFPKRFRGADYVIF